MHCDADIPSSISGRNPITCFAGGFVCQLVLVRFFLNFTPLAVPLSSPNHVHRVALDVSYMCMVRHVQIVRGMTEKKSAQTFKVFRSSLKMSQSG
jgi:hypothetical protein